MKRKLLLLAAFVASALGMRAGVHYTLADVPSITYSSKGVTTLTSGKTYVLYNAGTNMFLYIDDPKTPKLSATKASAFKLEKTGSEYYLHNERGLLAKDASSDWNTWANGDYGDEAKWTATLSSGKYKLKNKKKASGKYFGGGSGAGEGSQCYCDKGVNVDWYLIDLSDHTLAVSLLFQLNKAYDEYYEKATDGDAKTALGTALDGVYTTYVKAASFSEETYNAGIEALGAAIGTYLDSKLPVNNSGISLFSVKPTFGFDWTASQSTTSSDDVVEFYNKSGATISRNIVLPVGYYRLTCIGLTRTDYTSVLSVSDLANMNIATVGSATVNTKAAADTWFGKGYGVNELDFHVTTAKEVNVCLTADNGGTGDHWTVWKNFKLVYLGTSGDAQLNHEIYLDDLAITDANKAISDNANVLGSEYVALNGAISALVSYSGYGTNAEKVSERQALRYAIVAPKNSLIDAAANYNALATAITNATSQKTNNSGSGVFQYGTSAQEALQDAIDDATIAKSDPSTTAASALEAKTTLETAVAAVELNAPASGKRYTLTFHSDGHDNDGYFLTAIHNGRTDQGLYGFKYYTASANVNYLQAFKFTQISGNQYKVSFIGTDGVEQYITTSKKAYDTNTNEYIRATTIEDDALPIEIRTTTTAGQYILWNTLQSAAIAHNGSTNNDIFTKNSATFSVAEASQVSVGLSVKAGKWATRIFPFKPTLPAGVVAYTAVVEGSALNLTEVAEPAANVPYILKNNTGAEVNTNLTGYGVAKEDHYTVGALTGIYTQQEIPANSYVLQTQGGVQGFYKLSAKLDADKSVAYRAYLTVSSQVKAFYLDFDDTTGIDSVNGAIEGLLEGNVYDLSGRLVKNPTRGIYIVNGKKVLIK